MSRANRDRGGHLFDDLSTADVYEAAVTVMMRLVFLLSAEERGLFLLGDETYDSTYAVSTLRAQLEEEANTYGEEVIARRTDAWHRLLATFRMVFGGAQHENLRLPAYGGSLFDPDRFPFLEGRKTGRAVAFDDVEPAPDRQSYGAPYPRCTPGPHLHGPSRSKGGSPAVVPCTRRRTDRPRLRGPA